MSMPPTLHQLRTYAVSRSLFAPTTLGAAIRRLGFVQADPIRAPARAQDLTLRHRVKDYQADDLTQRYPRLAIEEDFFVNYGFMPRATHALMHPRGAGLPWASALQQQRAQDVLAFVQAKGVVHPREVDTQFAHGKARNWFGGNSNASTQLLDAMHYRGLLRIARRDGGVRLYAPKDAPQGDLAPDMEQTLDALINVVLAKYAPLPERSLSDLVSRLRGGAPQWKHALRDAFARAKQRLPSAEVAGQRWYWPADEQPASRRHALDEQLRLLAPFDPVVWDRRRFELFWGWAYRFEAYTPAPQRVRGYYALPLLWRGQVPGWANLSAAKGRLVADVGFVTGRAPADAGFSAALDDELQRLTAFLGLA